MCYQGANSGEEPFVISPNGAHKEGIDDIPLYLKFLNPRITHDSRSTVT